MRAGSAGRGLCALALLAVAAAALTCGKKGPLRPPQWVIPDTPSAVTATSAAGGIEVKWNRPREYSDGTALDDLGHFDVLRACEPSTLFEPVTKVPVLDRERFRKAHDFTWLDTTPKIGAVCRYQIVAVTTDDYYSAAGESASVRREPAPTPTPKPSPTPRSTHSP